jgi:hypothetical protein
MLTPEMKDMIAELDPDTLLADGFEEAFVGYCQQFNKTLACYDRALCIKKLMKDGMTEDEAEEFFEFNVVGAFVGDHTPVFLVTMEPE